MLFLPACRSVCQGPQPLSDSPTMLVPRPAGLLGRQVSLGPWGCPCKVPRVPRSPPWLSQSGLLSLGPGLSTACRLARAGSLCPRHPFCDRSSCSQAPPCVPGATAQDLSSQTPHWAERGPDSDPRLSAGSRVCPMLTNVPGTAGREKRDSGPAPCNPEAGAQDTGLVGAKQLGATGCQRPGG